MSSEQDRVRSIAERVARRLGGAPGAGESPSSARPASGDGAELDELRAGLSEIQRRLAHIESHITGHEHGERGAPRATPATPPRPDSAPAPRPAAPPGGDAPTRAPWLSGTYVPATSHPSEERFGGIGEAVSELVEYFEREKTCNLEPGGKPCDHCGMCSSRGF